MAGVGDCARDPERAQKINTLASGALAQATAQTGGWLLYTSSDLVFDGLAPPYAEDAPRTPVGPYMATKGAGEDAVLHAYALCMAGRTAEAASAARAAGLDRDPGDRRTSAVDDPASRRNHLGE